MLDDAETIFKDVDEDGYSVSDTGDYIYLTELDCNGYMTGDGRMFSYDKAREIANTILRYCDRVENQTDA